VTLKPAVRVIGCGNPDAGDDAAGLLAVRAARARLEDVRGVEVVEAGPGFALLELLDGAHSAIVVDAVRSGRGVRTPGSLIRLTIRDGERLPVAGSTLSSHGLALGDIVALAAELGMTSHVVILGVESKDVRAGRPLSPPVARALPSLVDAIVSEAGELLSHQRVRRSTRATR
jgi:hydrogenase maturation protease